MNYRQYQCLTVSLKANVEGFFKDSVKFAQTGTAPVACKISQNALLTLAFCAAPERLLLSTDPC